MIAMTMLPDILEVGCRWDESGGVGWLAERWIAGSRVLVALGSRTCSCTWANVQAGARELYLEDVA